MTAVIHLYCPDDGTRLITVHLVSLYNAELHQGLHQVAYGHPTLSGRVNTVATDHWSRGT